MSSSPPNDSIDGLWCAISPSVELRADSLFNSVDFDGKICYEFQCNFVGSPPSDMEQCHYIETYQLPHRTGGTITAHGNEKVAYDIGSGIRIGDAFKAADYLDGSFFDMKMTPDGYLRGWIREVHGNKKENAFAGVFTLERRGGVEPNFVSRFETIKRAATGGNPLVR